LTGGPRGNGVSGTGGAGAFRRRVADWMMGRHLQVIRNRQQNKRKKKIRREWVRRRMKGR
jgi:membrane protein YqaA with SNARE-associated domain